MMRCYHCHENDAEYRFFVSFQGYEGEVRLCGPCLEELQEYALGMFRDLQRDWSELLVHLETPEHAARIEPRHAALHVRRAPEDDWDPGDAVKDRRHLNELKAGLEAALAREDYELAIKLRDEIKNREKGVHIYDT